MLTCKWARLSSAAIISFSGVLSFPEMVSVQLSDHLLWLFTRCYQVLQFLVLVKVLLTLQPFFQTIKKAFGVWECLSLLFLLFWVCLLMSALILLKLGVFLCFVLVLLGCGVFFWGSSFCVLPTFLTFFGVYSIMCMIVYGYLIASVCCCSFVFTLDVWRLDVVSRASLITP